MSTDFYSNMQVCMRLRGMKVSDFTSHNLDINQIENALDGIFELDSRSQVLIAEKLGVEVRFLREDYISENGAEAAFREIYERNGIALVDEPSGSDPQGQDAPPESAEENSSTEVDDDSAEEESDLETIVVGGVEHDLTDKKVRVKIWTTANGLKEGTTADFIKALVALGVDRNVSWWSNLRYGNASLFRLEVETLAEYLGVSVGDLLGVPDSNQGSEDTSEDSESKSASPEEIDAENSSPQEDSSSETSQDDIEEELPETPDAVSEEVADGTSSEPVTAVAEHTVPQEGSKSSDHFRDLFFSETTEPAEGKTIGDLLVMARKDPAEVNWADAWFTMTKAGSVEAERIEKIEEELLNMDSEVRNLALMRIVQRAAKA